MDDIVKSIEERSTMVTIDGAIKELTERLELWEDFRDNEGAREWMEVMKLARVALIMQKQNAETKAAMLEDLREFIEKKPGGTFNPALVIDLINQFRTGEGT